MAQFNVLKDANIPALSVTQRLPLVHNVNKDMTLYLKAAKSISHVIPIVHFAPQDREKLLQDNASNAPLFAQAAHRINAYNALMGIMREKANAFPVALAAIFVWMISFVKCARMAMLLRS